MDRDLLLLKAVFLICVHLRDLRAIPDSVAALPLWVIPNRVLPFHARCHGARYSRVSSLPASSSPRISSFPTSQRILRPVRMEM